MKNILSVSALSALMLFTGSATASALSDAVDEQNQKFMDGIANNDAASISSVYSGSAVALVPNGNFVTGSENIQNLWQGFMDGGIVKAELETLELKRQRPDTAFEMGIYQLTNAAGEIADNGKYIIFWKLGTDGVWRYHRDIWNSSVPAR